jgi:hypothetical protein
MTIVTSDKPDEKRERRRLMEEFHRSTFDALRIEEPFFIPKLFYKPTGLPEKCIALFASEVAKGLDVYTENADAENISLDPDRRLYKWRYNLNFREEYSSSESNGSIRYFIPVSELILIKTNSPDILLEEKAKGPEQIKLDLKVHVDQEDIFLSNATLRDFAAVILKQPVSNKEWLNELIQKSK